MFKDKILIGAVIGILADAIKLTINYIFYILGFTKVVFWQIVATRFLQKEYLHHKAAYLIGGIADITTTSLLGVVFVYVMPPFWFKELMDKGCGIWSSNLGNSFWYITWPNS